MQTQNEVANREHLLHDTDDNFERQATQDVLPFFLGAVDQDRPKLRAELREAVRQEKLAQRRLDEFVAVGAYGFERGSSLIQEARACGLLDGDEPSASVEELEATLQIAVDNFKSRKRVPELSQDLLSKVDEAISVQYDRFQEIASQLRQIEEIESTQYGFASEVSEQLHRLASISLFTTPSGTHICPFCGTNKEFAANSDLEELREIIEAELSGVAASKPRFETLRKGLIDEKANVSDSLRELRIERTALLAQNAEFEAMVSLEEMQAQVYGRIRYYLESSALLVNDEQEKLKRILADRTQLVQRLRDRLDARAEDDLFDSALSVISKDITSMAIEVTHEYSGSPFRFDADKLTVIADTPSGPIAMNRMGSGENWVSCHLMAHCALHQWFIQNARPVPRFLLLDQPSQVYFPKEAEDTGGDDWIPVRRMYQLLHSRVEMADGELQIIVSDHVRLNDDWFDECIIEEWRDGAALVPADWIENNS